MKNIVKSILSITLVALISFGVTFAVAFCVGYKLNEMVGFAADTYEAASELHSYTIELLALVPEESSEELAAAVNNMWKKGASMEMAMEDLYLCVGKLEGEHINVFEAIGIIAEIEAKNLSVEATSREFVNATVQMNRLRPDEANGHSPIRIPTPENDMVQDWIRGTGL